MHGSETGFVLFLASTILLVDPTRQEEEFASGLITIVTDGKDICSFDKPGRYTHAEQFTAHASGMSEGPKPKYLPRRGANAPVMRMEQGSHYCTACAEWVPSGIRTFNREVMCYVVCTSCLLLCFRI